MRRLRSRRLDLGTFMLLMLAIPVSDVLAQQRPAEQTNLSAAPTGGIPGAKTFEQYAAYWSSEPGWDTELRLKNNLAGAPLTVTPVLRLASGREISMTPVTIPAQRICFSVIE